MQVIEITSLSGHSPFNISICDITRTYCYVVATGVSSIPLIVNIPTELSGTQELFVIVTDSIGCEETQYHNCNEPLPSQTQTPTPTPTPTNISCNCISIENPSGITLNFGYSQCDGTSFYGEIYSATTLFVCGNLPYGDSGLIINVSSEICSNNVCAGPSPTPTTTPTPTPTLPPIVGYFEDCCDSSNQFTLSSIPISFSPLSGVYYVESTGFVGCVTSVVSSSTLNFYSYISMGSQPSVNHCQVASFTYPCPSHTPTPSVTPTMTPTPTSSNTPTPTPTQTPTPTSPVKYILFQAQSCCGKKITKFLMLPSNFLPGTAVVNSYGECLEIIGKVEKGVWLTDYWNHGDTYIYCGDCIKHQTCEPVTPPSFISVWRTTSLSETIELPYETLGFYYGTIDWGDDTTSNNIYDNRFHTYDTPGDYTITITGTLIGWSFIYSTSYLNLIEVLQWGCLQLGNSGYNFFSCQNLTLTNVNDVLNLSGTNTLNELFYDCILLTIINNINSWDVSNIVNMSNTFFNCYNFNDDISNWDVSNVVDFYHMFAYNTLFNQPIGIWNTKSAQIMSGMFLSTSLFNQDIGNWVTSGVTDMSSMFRYTSSFNNDGSPSISGWTTSNVIYMWSMFESSPFNQPIGSWDVLNVTNMGQMFESATDFNQPLSGWNVSNVEISYNLFNNSISFNQDIGNWVPSGMTSVYGMFNGAYLFNNNGSPSISGWTTSNFINMSSMFYGAASFNQPIGSWDVSNVFNMNSVFEDASIFNQPLGDWIVSGASSMNRMFRNTTLFNQDIGSWDVSNVFNMDYMFQGGSPSNNTFNNNGSPSISAWTPTSLTSMFAMFNGCSFNQDIGNWDISSVTNFGGTFFFSSFNNGGSPSISGWTINPTNTVTMYRMFGGDGFNQPIGSWDVSKVNNMIEMFRYNSTFNQDIGSWNVSGVTYFTDFMRDKPFSSYDATYLDSIYNGWSSLPSLIYDININFGEIKYTIAGQPGKDILTGATNSWTITDGGI